MATAPRALGVVFAGTALLIGTVLLIAAAGCSEFTASMVCTDRGCLSGLAVRLEAPLPDGATVSVALTDAPWTVTCGEDANCSDFIFFENLRADHVTIRVRTPSSDRSWAFAPEYSLTKPNGPDCPGECFYAEITLPTGANGNALPGA